MQAINPAPFELRITNMQLLTEDVEFETEPAYMVLPAASTDQSLAITTIVLSGKLMIILFFYIL